MGYSTHPAISIVDVPVISIEILIIVEIARPRNCSLFAQLCTATSGYLASYLVVAVCSKIFDFWHARNLGFLSVL